MPRPTPEDIRFALKIALPSINTLLETGDGLVLAVKSRHMEEVVFHITEGLKNDPQSEVLKDRAKQTALICQREGLSSQQIEAKPWLADRELVAGAAEDTGFAVAVCGSSEEVDTFAAWVLWNAIAYLCFPNAYIPNL